MSFARTVAQFERQSKTVTRRLGWQDLAVGARITAIEKGQGLKKGERQRILGEIEVVAVRRERLDAITTADCFAEGFPELDPAGFVRMFGRPGDTVVTRIEYRYVVGAPHSAPFVRRSWCAVPGRPLWRSRDVHRSGTGPHTVPHPRH